MEPLLLATFIAYFVVVLGIGAYFYNRSAKMDEYFIADRQLNPYVVAMSAQASDMSGWLLMGLPGSILVAGVGEIWVGIGLAIGTYLAWLIIAKRLRIYSEKANNSITISEFFSNRFKDDKGTIRVLCGIVLLIFFTFYVASAFVSGGKILQAIFPDSGYVTMMLACAAIIIIYTFLGGFKAVCWTDFFQGLLMFVAVVIVPFALMGELGGFDEMISAVESIAATDGSFNIDFITCGWIAIVSGLAWGLGYFGMPHIHVRYMAIKNADDIKISRRVATTWVVIALACACLIGLFGRAWVDANNLVLENPENILILIVNEMWATSIPIFAGLIFAGIMAAVMSTADSQLLVASSSVSNDIYKHFKGDSISDEKLVWISRGIVIVVAIIAALIALDPASSIMNLVSFAWAGFGAAFGPLMILALFWKRTNRAGAIAGIVTGFLTTILWNTFLGSCIIAKVIGIDSLVIDTPVTGIYELLPGFLFALIAIVIVSLITS
ncbi:MAG: sodium/proline symporter PutP, partial [Candidatus Methanomethylophilaceae archaeon]|nr:sodium/proline symporter PutP [Candidatus Methanomethylophilaceae archaeon]